MTIPKELKLIGILGALGVALGALGAHALKNQIPGGLMTTDLLGAFETGVKYHMFHLLAMLMIVILKFQVQSKFLNWAYNLFFIGILLFSGSLYFLSTRHLLGAEWLRWLGPVTPLGGICLISGWLCLTMASFRKSKSSG